MGSRGPAPKKEAERRRKNKTDSSGRPNESEVIYVGDVVFDHSILRNAEWHPTVLNLWDAQSQSYPSNWMQPADWAMLAVHCESLSRALSPQLLNINPVTGEEVWGEVPLNGATLSAINKLASMLLMSEGDRRRLNIELEKDRRDQEKHEAKMVDIVQDRKALFATLPNIALASMTWSPHGCKGLCNLRCRHLSQEGQRSNVLSGALEGESQPSTQGEEVGWGRPREAMRALRRFNAWEEAARNLLLSVL